MAFSRKARNRAKAGKPFCTVDIETPEMAAFLKAIMGFRAWKMLKIFEFTIIVDKFNEHFPGGFKRAEEIGSYPGDLDTQWNSLYGTLTLELRAAGITNTSAPWLEPQLPKEIGGEPVMLTEEGVKVGCSLVDWDTVDLFAAKRKEFEK